MTDSDIMPEKTGMNAVISPSAAHIISIQYCGDKFKFTLRIFLFL